MMPKRSCPVETDWDQLYFLANKFMGWSVDEFLYDYGPKLTIDLINRHMEFDMKFKYGIDINKGNTQKKVNEPVEARGLFQELGF